jgi:hypothetical protein
LADNPYFKPIPATAFVFAHAMTTSHRSHTGSGTDPSQDLQIGLATAASLQESIRHADTKITMLFSIEGAVAMVTINRIPSLISTPDRAALLLGTALLLALLTGLATTTCHLILAFRPRLSEPMGNNRFGFPHIARVSGRLPMASARQQRDDAWELVSALARIAMAKHLRVRRSLPWLTVSLASAAGLLIDAMLTMPMAQ